MQLIVICSIHQPSTATFDLFDNLLLLSGGKTCFQGPVQRVKTYFDNHGFIMPSQINPAEFILDLVNTDFSNDDNNNNNSIDKNEEGFGGGGGGEGENPEMRLAIEGRRPPEKAKDRLRRIHKDWANSRKNRAIMDDIVSVNKENTEGGRGDRIDSLDAVKPNFASMLLTLLHRAFIKSYRDIVAYWVRVVMYMGLSILMGTVWLRLDANQESIQPFINSIFFGAACRFPLSQLYHRPRAYNEC